jgi:hypothetical protein
MRCNRVMVAGVSTVTLKAECFRPELLKSGRLMFQRLMPFILLIDLIVRN